MVENTEGVPLRERFTVAERLARDLIDHIEHGFLPKTAHLRRLVRSGSGDSAVTDKTVRDHVKRLLDTDQFTADVYARFEKWLRSIEKEVTRIIESGRF